MVNGRLTAPPLFEAVVATDSVPFMKSDGAAGRSRAKANDLDTFVFGAGSMVPQGAEQGTRLLRGLMARAADTTHASPRLSPPVLSREAASES